MENKINSEIAKIHILINFKYVHVRVQCVRARACVCVVCLLINPF